MVLKIEAVTWYVHFLAYEEAQSLRDLPMRAEAQEPIK